jgi:acyl-CoA synthetase (AMP-forming)/AMP-acid ligase II
MLSHFNFGTMMNIVTKHLHEQVMTKLDPNWKWENESFLLMLPFYHIYGFGVLANSILRGSKGIIMTHFDHEVFCRSIQKYKVNLSLGPFLGCGISRFKLHLSQSLEPHPQNKSSIVTNYLKLFRSEY